jgi:hypothetical protein
LLGTRQIAQTLSTKKVMYINNLLHCDVAVTGQTGLQPNAGATVEFSGCIALGVAG